MGGLGSAVSGSSFGGGGSASTGSPGAGTQASWFFSSSTGSDANDGKTSGTALRTWAEYVRRVGSQSLSPPFDASIGSNVLRYNFLSDLPDTDPISGDFFATQDVIIHFIGGVKTVNATGTFTAVTNKAPATNTPFALTDGALAGGWAAHVGRRVRITTVGARLNAIMWVAHDLGAGAMNPSDPAVPVQMNPLNFWQNTLTPVTPLVGDAYSIESLFVVTMGSLRYRATGDGTNIQQFQPVFGQLEFRRSDGAAAGWWNVSCLDFCFLNTYSCKIWTAVNPHVDNFVSNNDYWVVGAIITGGEESLKQGGLCVSDETPAGAQYGLMSMGPMIIAFDSMFWKGSIRGRSVMIVSASVFNAVSNSENRGGHAVHVGLLLLDINPSVTKGGPPGGMVCGPFLIADPNVRLWGSGNAGAGINISPGSRFSCSTPANLTVTGTGGDFLVGGVATAFPFDTVARTYSAAVATTWANFAANNNHLHRPDLAADIVTGV